MSFLERLLSGTSGETVVQSITEPARAAFELIDESFDTDQEKRESKKEFLSMLIQARQAAAVDGNADARRWFLQQITNYVMALATAALIAQLAGKNEIVKTILDIADKFYLGWAFVAAVSFFFLVDVSAMGGIKLPGFKRQ